MPINDKMPCGDHKNSLVVSREWLACRDGWLCGEPIAGLDAHVRPACQQRLDTVTDVAGNGVEVRFLRHAAVEPPWPEFEQAIVDAIREWKYATVLVNGTPQPIIVTITVAIDVR